MIFWRVVCRTVAVVVVVLVVYFVLRSTDRGQGEVAL